MPGCARARPLDRGIRAARQRRAGRRASSVDARCTRSQSDCANASRRSASRSSARRRKPRSGSRPGFAEIERKQRRPAPAGGRPCTPDTRRSPRNSLERRSRLRARTLRSGCTRDGARVASFEREASGVLSDKLGQISDAGTQRLEKRLGQIAAGLERQRRRRRCARAPSGRGGGGADAARAGADGRRGRRPHRDSGAPDRARTPHRRDLRTSAEHQQSRGGIVSGTTNGGGP